MTELEMRKHIENRVTEKNFTNHKGKSQTIEKGAFANKLLSDGVYVVADAIKTEVNIKRRGRKNKILLFIEEKFGSNYLKDEDNIICLSLSLVELVLSKLYLDDRKVTMRISVANKIVETLLEGDRNNNEHIQMGVSLFETVVDALPFVHVEYLFENGEKRIIYSLEPNVLEDIKFIINRFIREGYYPMPITEKPTDWEFIGDKLIGGYNTMKSELIRSSKVSMPNSMFDPISLRGKEPIRALNKIQSVAYRVNKNNLIRLKNDLKLPSAPIIPDGFKQWGKDWYEYKEDKKMFEQFGGYEPIKPEVSEKAHESFVNYMSAKKKYISDIGKYNTNMLSLQIAEDLVDEERIYFPHNFDYRGRMYPIPIGLSPQGNDVAKGLLEFADPIELTQSGVTECVAYLASVYGYDKESWDRRYQLGLELMQNQNTSYKDAEEPYVFAQIWDLIWKVNSGNRESRVAIAIDGSCNGLQHMSAITLDKSGGKNVNVSKENVRYDIYQIIAEKSVDIMKLRLTELSNGISEESEELEYKLLPELIEIMQGNKSRKIAKRPVMINPYGGSFNGYKGYVLESLKEYFPVHGNQRSAGIITKYINEAMKQNLKGGNLYKKWVSSAFKEVANRLKSHKEGSVYFTTPDGFIVRNFMYEVKSKTFDIKSLVSRNGARKVKLQRVTDKINSRKISTAIQPNIIHSLDATHLRMTALKMVDNGFEQLWFIHDSFATNPNDISILNKYTRETFVELYEPNSDKHPLKFIYKDLEEQLGYIEKDFPTFQGKNRMSIGDVLQNEFFFA
tara:strand:+ start:58884 stop:61250 length:2367 start_codon:yes stop_codon:yes gene_type:complete